MVSQGELEVSTARSRGSSFLPALSRRPGTLILLSGHLCAPSGCQAQLSVGYMCFRLCVPAGSQARPSQKSALCLPRAPGQGLPLSNESVQRLVSGPNRASLGPHWFVIPEGLDKARLTLARRNGILLRM